MTMLPPCWCGNSTIEQLSGGEVLLYRQLSGGGGGVELLHSKTDRGHSTMGDNALYNTLHKWRIM